MSGEHAEEQVSIVESGTPAVEVVWWSADESPVAAFAADELQTYVREMTEAVVTTTMGTVEDLPDSVDSAVAVVPVVTAEERRSPTDKTVQFRSEWTETMDRAVSDADPDSFAVRTVEDAVLLAGTTDRGTLYAAYELLETLGVRFYAPDFPFYDGAAEFVPTKDTLSAPPLDIVEEPSLTYRRKDLAEGRSHTAGTVRALVDWMAKTRHNVLATPANFTNLELGVVTWDGWRDEVVPELEKRGIILETGGHGFDAFLPPEEYEPSHPEWFVDDYNVFDITNEEAVQTYVDNTVEYLAEHPEIDVFDAWPPDGADWPPRVVEQFGSSANAYAYVVNRLTEALRERLPERDVEIEAIAYTSHLEVPDPEYMYDEATIIDFAPFDRSYTEPIFESETGKNREYVELMSEWREAFDGTLSTYEYYRKYSWHSLPVVMPDLIGGEIPFYESIGLDGLWIYSEPADWIPYELTHALVGALMWDTGLDADAYVETYLAERYGPAADEVAAYLDCVERAGRTLFTKFRGDYDDLDAVAAALEDFRRAREHLASARQSVDDGGTAAFLLDRLETNAEFAVADTEISYYELRGDEAEAQAARERTRDLVEGHAFDGVVLHSNWALDRCTPEEQVPDAADLIQSYQRTWGE